MNRVRLIPDTPTLYPSMLLHRAAVQRWLPFGGGDVYWYFLARNAIAEACRLLNLKGGEVLMPAYHHGAEVEAVAASGARPVFYRVDAHWRVDLADLERRIGPHTRALYLIHYAGFPGPALRMRHLANQYGLSLIEDCVWSLLSSEGVANLGTRGDISIFCLSKTLPVPNGGALKFNKLRKGSVRPVRAPPLATVMRQTLSSLLLNLEMRAGAVGGLLRAGIGRLGNRLVRAADVDRVPVGTMHFEAEHADLGISALARTLARAQPLDEIIATRRRNYLLLHNRLKASAQPLFQQLDPGVCPLFYPLWVKDKPVMLARLNQRGIRAVDFWNDHHPDCDPGEFPDAMRARRHVLEIPCHQDLSLETMAWIAAEVEIALRASTPEIEDAALLPG